MDKKMNFYTIALICLGAISGAGYVSGKELYQFFGRFGLSGFIGLVFAIVLIGALINMTALIARRLGSDDFFANTGIRRRPVVYRLVSIFLLLYYVGIVSVMLSFGGALLNMQFGINNAVGNILTFIPAFLVVLSGKEGISASFRVVTPVMIIMAVVTGLAQVVTNGLPQIVPVSVPGTNPVISSLLYSSYNFVGMVSIVSLMGNSSKSRKDTILGGILGSLFLFTMAFVIMLAMSSALPLIEGSQLPMLTIANSLNIGGIKLGGFIGIIYAVVLMIGVFTTSVTFLFTSKLLLNQLVPVTEKWGGYATGAIALVTSFFGFGTLVATIYPIAGYIGLLIEGLVIVVFLRIKGAKNNTPKDI